MAEPGVVRIKRTDAGAATFVLLHTSQHGAQPLDVKLLGTDGEAPFATTLQHQRISGLRAKNYSGSDDEWQAILASSLLQRDTPGQAAAAEGVEIVASVRARALTLTVRRHIAGIAQRLGQITLPQNDDEEISLFDWTVRASSAAESTRAELAALQRALAEQAAQIARLHAQLDALVAAKGEHDSELLRKFAVLLNAKKRKIREQLRLLGGAEEAGAGTAARVGTAAGSRGSKRKAGRALSLDVDGAEQGGDGGARAESGDGEEMADVQTEHSDEAATADEDSDAEGFAPAPAAGLKGVAGQVFESRAMDAEIPPKRALPFATGGESAEHAAPQQSADGDDDGETDDEL